MSKRIKEIIVRYDDKQNFIYGNTLGEVVGDLVRCENCRKSHIDGKTTHYLWCTEWGRSTDPFGYCERGEREGE